MIVSRVQRFTLRRAATLAVERSYTEAEPRQKDLADELDILL